MRALVKAVLALTLIAVLGSALAGCGASKRAVSRLIIVTRTTTVSNVKTGVFIGCKGGPAAKVPPRGEGVDSSASQVAVTTTIGVPPAGAIQLTHLKNGSVTVSCRP
jgi:hypothetical protein